MKIGTVLTATNDNPLYIDFIPMFVQAWKNLLPEADICIVLINDHIPPQFQQYSQYIHLFPSIDPSINTAFQAQCIRLLYPRLITKNSGVLITDMDMIPLQRSYYVDTISHVPDDAFVCYRNVCLPEMISMCYNIALPHTWLSIFGNDSIEHILKSWYSTSNYDGLHGGNGWCTDQYRLIDAINSWKNTEHNVVIFNDQQTGFTRLDRLDFSNPISSSFLLSLAQNVHNEKYCDYHCLRPYSAHKFINDFILQYCRRY